MGQLQGAAGNAHTASSLCAGSRAGVLYQAAGTVLTSAQGMRQLGDENAARGLIVHANALIDEANALVR